MRLVGHTIISHGLCKRYTLPGSCIQLRKRYESYKSALFKNGKGFQRRTQTTIAPSGESLRSVADLSPSVPSSLTKESPQDLETTSDAVNAIVSIMKVARFSPPGKAQAQELLALVQDDPRGVDILFWLTNPSRRRSLVLRVLDEQSAAPVLVLHLLYMADRLTRDTDADLYHFVAFNLVSRKRWAWLAGLVRVQIELTGSTTVEMLNWMIVSFVRRKERMEPSEILQMFKYAELKPTSRTHKLLAELSKLPRATEAPTAGNVSSRDAMSLRDMSSLLLHRLPKPVLEVDKRQLKRHSETINTIQAHFKSIQHLVDLIKHHDSPERLDSDADAASTPHHFRLRMFRLNLCSLLDIVGDLETKRPTRTSKPHKNPALQERAAGAGSAQRDKYAAALAGDMRSTLKLLGDLAAFLAAHDAKYAPLEEDVRTFYRRLHSLQTKGRRRPSGVDVRESGRDGLK